MEWAVWGQRHSRLVYIEIGLYIWIFNRNKKTCEYTTTLMYLYNIQKKHAKKTIPSQSERTKKVVDQLWEATGIKPANVPPLSLTWHGQELNLQPFDYNQVDWSRKLYHWATTSAISVFFVLFRSKPNDRLVIFSRILTNILLNIAFRRYLG